MTEAVQNGRTSNPPPPREGTFVFLSELLGKPVRGPDGAALGKVVDFLADAGEPSYPRVTALRIKRKGVVLRAEWAEVESCEPGGTRLRRGAESLQELKLLGSEIPLAQDVLDKQIVDT